MTPSDAARLSALEARERTRDALLLEASDAAWILLRQAGRVEWAAGLRSVQTEFRRTREPPPSPPAAEGERTYEEICEHVVKSVSTPGPTPETIARVREALEWIATKYAGYASGKRAHDALRLLDAERETGPTPATIALPWLHPALEGWSIVGMNHYHVSGERRLFVAMTHGRGACVKVEGPDAPLLWDELRQATAAALARPLDAERETAP